MNSLQRKPVETSKNQSTKEVSLSDEILISKLVEARVEQ
jgi:hypothetical protein